MLKGKRNREIIRDCTQGGPPTKKHLLPDGTIRLEKLPWIPLTRKMVDPDGNVVYVSLANGHTNRWTEYSAYIEAEKKKAGFLNFAECPVATRALPYPENEARCPEAGADGRMPKDSDGQARCCKHIRAVIEKRREIKRAKNDKFANRLASSDAALKQAIQEQTAWMRSIQATRGTSAPVFKSKRGSDE